MDFSEEKLKAHPRTQLGYKQNHTFYQNNTVSMWLIAIFGGVWYNYTNNGEFAWNLLNNTSSHARNFGGRLVYIPQ